MSMLRESFQRTDLEDPSTPEESESTSTYEILYHAHTED